MTEFGGGGYSKKLAYMLGQAAVESGQAAIAVYCSLMEGQNLASWRVAGLTRAQVRIRKLQV